MLGVLLVHTGAFIFPGGLIKDITALGAKGVQLFFFISAFTIFLSYQHQVKIDTSPIRSFYIKRVFRIAPMYYLGIIYFALYNYLNGRAISIEGILLNASFLHSFSPNYINNVVPGGWSIGIEMSFYLLVPLLVFYITNLKRAISFVVFCLIIRIVSLQILNNNPFGYNDNTWNQYMYWFLPNQLQCFSFGILFYFFNQRFLDAGNKDWNYLIPIAAVLAIIFFSFKKFLPIELLNDDFLIMIVVFLLTTFLSRNEFPLLVNAPIVTIGKYSYSIYLVHFAVLYILEQYVFETMKGTGSFLYFALLFSVVLTITYIVSSLTFRYIEMPMQQFAKQLTLNFKWMPVTLKQ